MIVIASVAVGGCANVDGKKNEKCFLSFSPSMSRSLSVCRREEEVEEEKKTEHIK